VSKTPAKKTSHPARPAAKKPAATARSKSSAASKVPAKKKPAPRPAAKPAGKPAIRKTTAARPTAKTSAKATAKKAPPEKKTPERGAASHKPVARAAPTAHAPTKATAVSSTHPTVPHKPAAKASPPARAAAPKSAKTPVVMTTSPPSPLTSSRFADRFAPPKPPTRQMNHEDGDVVRQTYKADPKLANAWKTKSGRDLTEPELLSMPDSEYMNDKQLEFFRARLQALKDDLLSNAGETTEHLREDTTIVPDPADRATIEEEHALELRTRDRERKLLKKISQSLARIDAGDYGFCDETGEPIGLGRLIARPTATLSLEAQQRRELKQKMFGD
jgi:DnaK suppressor protein